MRIISILTALLVMGFLYLLVFERERLYEFSGNDTAAAAQVAATDASATAPATDTPTELSEVSDQAEEPAGVAVLVQASNARLVDQAVILRGETAAARQVDVRAETTALVTSTPLRKGAFVEEGTLLCELDPGTRGASLEETMARLAEARARVPEAEARVEEARARVLEAEINNTAAARLSEDGFASETRVATARAALRGAQASLASAQSGLESTQAGIRAAEAAVAVAEREIDKLEIRAPFSGLLESDAAELGSLMDHGGLCATVIQLDPIKLVGFVPETEVNRVNVGALAGARLVTGQEVQGTVQFLSRSADPTTRTFRVEIEVPNGELAIRDGQTAEIAIRADGTKAHLLPQSSLTLDDEGALGVRLVTSESVVAFQPVTLLRDTPQGVWLGGLPDAADVIVRGQEFVTDGVPVKVTYLEATQ